MLVVWDEVTWSVRQAIINRNLEFQKRVMGFTPDGFLVDAMGEDIPKNKKWVIEYKTDDDLDGLGQADSNEEEAETKEDPKQWRRWPARKRHRESFRFSSTGINYVVINRMLPHTGNTVENRHSPYFVTSSATHSRRN
ncbi:hypothetical protein SUGI_0949770 [Cryptomeria japonica]|nr:hypothetical protein SUGI_0949770 [Cryptomeria japonica]